MDKDKRSPVSAMEFRLVCSVLVVIGAWYLRSESSKGVIGIGQSATIAAASFFLALVGMLLLRRRGPETRSSKITLGIVGIGAVWLMVIGQTVESLAPQSAIDAALAALLGASIAGMFAYRPDDRSGDGHLDEEDKPRSS